jgi:hypothetical protein
MFLLNGEQLVEMREQAYDSEDLLQAVLARYPDLLAGGGELPGSPRRAAARPQFGGEPDAVEMALFSGKWESDDD